MDSNFYVPFFSFYYLFFTTFGVSLQFLLIYLITYKSPATLDYLKLYLYNTSFVQLGLIISAFFTQHRTLPNKDSLAILALGPCTHFGPNVCFAGYHLHMALLLASGLASCNTILFRYLVLVRNVVTQKQIVFMISASHIGPICLLIIPFTAKWDYSEVYQQAYSEHPSYDLSIYEPYPGFAKVSNLQFMLATFILAVGVYCVPLACAVLTRNVLILIRFHQNMSEKTKKQATTLVHGLFMQTILPCIAYIPIFGFYLYTQLTAEEILITQHLILASSSAPGLIDPLISIYFIIPYRVAVQKRVLKKMKSDVFIVARSMSSK